jgi:hypothetical protein
MDMTPKRPNRTTIIVEPAIRDSLKHIARKDQSYNELLVHLIKLHNDQVKKEVGRPSQPGEAQPTAETTTQPRFQPRQLRETCEL